MTDVDIEMEDRRASDHSASTSAHAKNEAARHTIQVSWLDSVQKQQQRRN